MHTLHRDHVMEKKVFNQFYHEHPLSLMKNVSDDEQIQDCYGCRKSVANTDMVYVCMQEGCTDGCILHKKCGELPYQIWLPQHSNHPMNLFYFLFSYPYHYDPCGICMRFIYNKLGYRCSSCDFNVHRKCAKASIEARHELEHLSHPHHPLTLFRKPRFSFHCNGCGDEDVDTAYVCSTCEFWLHKRCASLPTILPVDEGCHDHHHPLSLIFSLPKKHCRYKYRCDVCNKYCDQSRWAYFCDECRYIVHIKCAIRSSTMKPDDSNLNEDGGDVIEFPRDADDISHKLIKPFVMRKKGLINTISTSSGTNTSYLLEYYHEHPLRYVSEFTRRDDGDNEEKDDEEEDIEEESKICDVCITPITNSYYECATSTNCTYSIHSICSLLPHTLQHSSSSSSNIKSSLLFLGECGGKSNKNHNFTLISSKGRDAAFSPWDCYLCGFPTNGMGYECGDCGKKVDVKCASLPTTIRHATHTRCHRKPLIFSLVSPTTRTHNVCHVCNSRYIGIGYYCSQGECDFSLHLRCAMLPLSIKYREWDKHPLMLTSDASLNHPSDFFCEFCEEEMHPKSWMYHCRHCDASFHPNCLDTGSGYYMNVKIGRRYKLDGIHPNHPLTFTCITLKKHCDLCHKRVYVYTYLGFECASCYYVVCEDCGVKELE